MLNALDIGRAALAATVVIGTASAFSVDANAAILKETFPWTGTTTQDQELRDQDWCGGNAGDAFCNNPPGTVANQGGEGAISAGNGRDGTPGFAFWSQTGINADSFLYTEKVSFNPSEVPEISWYQRDSGSDPMRVAFKSGSDWYISDQIFTQPDESTWQLQVAELATLTFFQRTQSGSTLPGGGVPGAPGGLPVPDLVADAFGFWWDGPKTATSRLDDVNVVPLPGAVWLLASGVAAVGAMRHRARRRNAETA
jgi:hypothetical protein